MKQAKRETQPRAPITQSLGANFEHQPHNYGFMFQALTHNS